MSDPSTENTRERDTESGTDRDHVSSRRTEHSSHLLGFADWLRFMGRDGLTRTCPRRSHFTLLCVVGFSMFSTAPALTAVCEDMELAQVVRKAAQLIQSNSPVTAVIDCYGPYQQAVVDTDVASLADAQLKERFLFEHIDALLRYATAVQDQQPDEAKTAIDRAKGICFSYHNWRTKVQCEIKAQLPTQVLERPGRVTRILGEIYERLMIIADDEGDEAKKRNEQRGLFEAYRALAREDPDPNCPNKTWTTFDKKALIIWVRQLEDFSTSLARDVTDGDSAVRVAYQRDFEYQDWWQAVQRALDALKTVLMGLQTLLERVEEVLGDERIVQ